MNDFKYAVRVLSKNPIFSFVAILTLAIGIGANTVIYTVVEAVLLEPLRFEQHTPQSGRPHRAKRGSQEQGRDEDRDGRKVEVGQGESACSCAAVIDPAEEAGREGVHHPQRSEGVQGRHDGEKPRQVLPALPGAKEPGEHRASDEEPDCHGEGVRHERVCVGPGHLLEHPH